MGLLSALGLTRSAEVEPSDAGRDIDVDVLPILLSKQDSVNVYDLYREQPHLRTVTTFIARMVATVSLHVYQRAADGGRERVRDGAVAVVMRKPNEHESMFDFMFRSVMDLCLHDEILWYVTTDGDGRPILERIPPEWILKRAWDGPWRLERLAIRNKHGKSVWLDGDNIIRIHGYSPETVRWGVSPIDALRDVLREQMESAAYRAQLWKNGPRLGGIITRPAGIQWDDVARRRFKAAWRAQYSGRGSGAGGVPVLEDGMQFQAFHLNARDEQLPEMTKLSLATVAQVYHINPTMVGLLDNANYSNVREFRQSLYGDSLGPLMKQIESVLNEFLVPILASWDKSIDADSLYIEFNIEERLRGRFEEQAAVTSTAVGGPWMTRNEARAMNNLPAVDGGDELIVPLNVTAGDEPPGDAESPNPAPEPPSDDGDDDQ